MKRSEADEHRAEILTLVRSFISCATSEFAQLVDSPAARWSIAVEHATSRGIVEVAPEDITGFFFITAHFANDSVAGQLSFGDREFDVNMIIGPVDGGSRYALWEWADALDQPDLVPRDTAFVNTVSRLAGIVAAMAGAVRILQSPIATAPPDVIERIENARAAAHERFQRQLASDNHRHASAAAAQAFRAGDYARAILLLEPIEASLTPAERGQLAYARKHA